MANEVFKISIPQEMVDYVQRLGREVDANYYIIDRMFENHKNDTDTSIFDSVPFKHYMSNFEHIKAEYDMAVDELGNKLIPIVAKETGIEDPSFDWKIEDFSLLEVIITMR